MCHIHIEARTCDKAARVLLPVDPTRSPFVVTVPLGTALLWTFSVMVLCVWCPVGVIFSSPARACSVVGCLG